MKNLERYFNDKEWEVVHRFQIPERKGRYEDYRSLNLSEASLTVLKDYKDGVYRHQYLAISEFSKDSNVCISTSTSSGKTLAFHICGIETLVNDPEAKILAIYPLKALGTEQEARWRDVINTSCLDHNVGRIDGSVSQVERERIIKSSSIIIMTPDVMHAWLLSHVAKPAVAKFLRNLSLIIIDEAHTYSGVFGSNSAFLYRRLQHLISMAGGNYRYIAASATIKNPKEHLKNLTGEDFTVVGNEDETSPKRKINVVLVNPPKSNDLLSSLSGLMRFIVNNTDYQFITFVDSRKQTEYIATISARKSEKPETEDLRNLEDTDFIGDLPVCPYRSGYEETDRSRIQNKLTEGKLRGVISTSALEMGIDIPHINLGILIGVPGSATSFYQRIGRIGRHKDGIIVIVNNGSIQTESIFREPDRLMEMPLSESALYLENPRIQYIHALCLSRQGGEDDSFKNLLGIDTEEFEPKTNFPDRFVDICGSERIGEIPLEFQTMKSQAGDDPNHTFPLRDVDLQFKVEFKRGPVFRNLGTLSFAQVMREAYPGAVYYYQTEAFRVYRLNSHKKLVEVRPEKKYTTKPTMLPTLIFPNLSEGNVIESKKFGDLILVECALQIRESISGFSETRGKNEINVTYPLDRSLGLYFDISRFTRNYFTSGIIINHPALNSGVKTPLLAEIIYEAFFMVVPFERQDINYGSDKHRADRLEFRKESRFISVFDQTYGSLRLTGRFMNTDILKDIFFFALEIAENDPNYRHNIAEINALRAMNEELGKKEELLIVSSDNSYTADEENCEKVILPGSKGMDIRNGRNEEFFVEEIFYSPKLGLSYKGRHLSETSIRMTTPSDRGGVTVIIVPVKGIQEIPGESSMGLYNYETAEIVETD